MNLDYLALKKSPFLIKKYVKNMHKLPADLQTKVALYKIVEHDKMKFLHFIPDSLLQTLKIQNDKKLYSLKYFLKVEINDKQLDKLIDLINRQDHLAILYHLDKLSTDISYVFVCRRILKMHKYNEFKNMEIYLKNNIYVPKIVARFLNFYKSFLPPNFVDIILSSGVDISYFINLISSLRPDLQFIDIKEDLMKFDLFRNAAISQGFGENKFLVKYVKSDDFEFYLRMHNLSLDEYKNNGIKIDHNWYPHMKIYNLLKGIPCLINPHKKYNSVNTEQISLDKDTFYKTYKKVNLVSMFNRDVDILLLEIIVNVLCFSNDTISLDKIFYYNRIFKVLDESLYFSLINFNLVDYLKTNLEKIDKIPDDFLIRDFKISDIEKYEFTNLKKEMIDKAIYIPTEELVNIITKKFEDERKIYYEILLKQSFNQKLHKCDIKIFNIESNDTNLIQYKQNILKTIESDFIYEKLKNTDLFFKYCINHEKYALKYLENINCHECTLEEGKNIFTILNIYKSAHSMICKNKGNLIYKVSTTSFKDLDLLTDDKIGLVSIIYHVRYDEGIYFFYKYSDRLISHYIIQNLNLTKDKTSSSFLYMNYLSNKYLFHSLNVSDKDFKYILKFIPTLDNKYIKILINLLNDTNMSCVLESKRLLNSMHCINQDINSIKSQIIESFIDKINVNNTLLSILSLQFNYMIDDTSLILILELIRRYIKEYKEYIFIILSKIQQIVINKDLFKKEVFQIISLFVIQNNFYTEECINIVRLNINNLSIDSLDLLFKNIDNDLRIAYFLVEVLKIINNDDLNKQVIFKDLDNNTVLSSRPNFLAYAFDLEIFYKYLDNYFPVLKQIYCTKENKIAVHAFSKLIYKKNDQSEDNTEHNDIVFKFVSHESFINSSTRMSCVEILSKQILTNKICTLLYIYKYDDNGLIRKRVSEILKNRIENYNILIRSIYEDILKYLNYYYYYIPDISNNVINELITKYINIFDLKYCKRYTNIYPLLLLHGIKKNKLITECKEYLMEINVDNTLITEIDGNTLIKEMGDSALITESNIIMPGSNTLITEIGDILLEKDKEFMLKYLTERLHCNSVFKIIENNYYLVYTLLMYNNDLINNLDLLKLLNENDKKTLFEYITKSNKDYTESMAYLLQNTTNINISDCDIEIIYLYLCNCNSTDINLYKKVFNRLNNAKLQKLIIRRNYKYILDVSYKNITEYENLIKILTSKNNIQSIDRLYEIYGYVDNKSKERIVDYFIYNFLIYEHRGTIRSIFSKIDYIGGYKKDLILNVILNVE